MNTDKRSLQQNKAYFKFQEFVSDTMNNQGITLDKLVVEVQPRPTKTSLHEVFKSILLAMYNKDSTKDMTREEMSEVLDVYFLALARIGISLEFPDESKRTLLQFYS
jgi:hypothetical protein